MQDIKKEEEGINKNLLKSFYEHVFPFQLMYKWLSYGDKSSFSKREFSFSVGSMILRYQCFKTAEDFKKSVVKLIPNKIDIGPIYSISPAEQHSVSIGKFKPKSKEFVIDIDISDYDNVRLCGCKEAKVCNSCWQLMECGMKVLDHLLNDVFGCKHRLWVFSGRRGIHCWVADEQFRILDNQARASIADFLHIYIGSDKQSKKVNLTKIPHPSFGQNSEVFRICEEYFVKLMCEEMQLLESEEKWSKLLELITFESISELLNDLDSKGKTPKEKWDAIKKKLVCNSLFLILDKAKERAQHFILEIVYAYTYPRLDINVSKGFNHLLKSPFCVHPSTGLICVPITVEDTFSPAMCPNIQQLMEGDYKARIKKYITRLTKFVESLEKAENKEDKMDIDF